MSPNYYVFAPAYGNDLEALNPQWWAMESLVVLEEMLVVANHVNQDYNDLVANAGDTVHVDKPGTFVAKHKMRGNPVTVQDATTTDNVVRLNQHIETTFHLDDRDVGNAIPDLRRKFLVPAIRSIAEGVDAAIVGEAAQFYMNASGQVGTALTKDSIIDLDRIMNDKNVPMDNRLLVLGSRGKADVLKLAEFSTSDKTGAPSALLTGRLGEIMGYQTYVSQTVGRMIAGGVATTAEVAGVGIMGANTLSITSAAAGHAKGTWFKIAGTPGIYRLTAAITSTNTSMAFYPALAGPVTSSSAITFYESTGVVDGSITADYEKIRVNTDGYTSAAHIPRPGQAITIGDSDTTIYTVKSVEGTWVNTSTDIVLVLNRPLDVSITDGQQINVVPSGGSYNIAMTPDAITLVNRPLAPASAGVEAYTANNGAFALRVTMSYDPDYMRHKVTVDTLLGVKAMDPDQGAWLLN